MASQVGQSTEFLGTRDWRQGDRLRDIHWPSSARTGRLITREFQEEYFVRVAVVLDIQALWARDEKRMEQAISLAAGLITDLAGKEYIIDFFAAGDDLHHVQAGRAITQMDHVLELLACIEPADGLNVDILQAALLAEVRQLSTIIFVMMKWNAPRLRLVQRLRSEGANVRVICVKKGWQPTGLDPLEVIQGVGRHR